VSLTATIPSSPDQPQQESWLPPRLRFLSAVDGVPRQQQTEETIPRSVIREYSSTIGFKNVLAPTPPGLLARTPTTAGKYLRKGTTVYLEGKNKTRSYDDKQGNKRYVTEIIGDHILILDKKEQ